MTPQQFIDQTVARIQAEIIEDIRAGRVDAGRVSCFGDLHDFVDANCYGGMCEDEFCEAGNALFPRADGEDDDTIYSQALMGAGNTIQDTVDAWIRSDDFTNAVRGVAA